MWLKSSLLSLSCTIAVIALSSLDAQQNIGQKVASSETDDIPVSLTKLSKPVYPPIALQTQISGDVELKLLIRPNGIVETAQSVSGHPLLRQSR